MTSSALVAITAGVFGAAIGSFLNVVIHRLPRGKSIVAGRSHCPQCRATICWYDNVPLLSWLILRGRCRRCAGKIPLRYPLVELVTALSAVVAVLTSGPTLVAAWVFAFMAIMVAITCIDWEHQIIPDALSIGGTVLGWIGAGVCLDITVLQAVLGSLVGAALILGIAGLYRVVRRIDGMGGGDVKLMAMIGAFLGWQMVFAVLLLAAFAGSAYGLYLMRREKAGGQTAVAFGSFLAPAACLMWFVGERVMELYLGTLGAPR